MTEYFHFVSHKGSVTPVTVYTTGANCSVVERQRDIDIIKNKVQVLGYGTGADQIKSVLATHGQDATSQATWGVREYSYTDRSITTVDQANKVADEIIAGYKDPGERIKLNVVTRNFTEVVGDVITINNVYTGLASNYRIVAIDRQFGSGGDILVYECESKPSSIISYLEEQGRNMDDTLRYALGAREQLVFKTYGNASSTQKVNMRFRTPDLQSVKKVTLVVSRESMQYDVDANAAGQAVTGITALGQNASTVTALAQGITSASAAGQNCSSVTALAQGITSASAAGQNCSSVTALAQGITSASAAGQNASTVTANGQALSSGSVTGGGGSSQQSTTIAQLGNINFNTSWSGCGNVGFGSFNSSGMFVMISFRHTAANGNFGGEFDFRINDGTNDYPDSNGVPVITQAGDGRNGASCLIYYPKNIANKTLYVEGKHTGVAGAIAGSYAWRTQVIAEHTHSLGGSSTSNSCAGNAQSSTVTGSTNNSSCSGNAASSTVTGSTNSSACSGNAASSTVTGSTNSSACSGSAQNSGCTGTTDGGVTNRGVYNELSEAGALIVNYDIDSVNRGNITNMNVGTTSTEIDITNYVTASGTWYLFEIYPTTLKCRVNYEVKIELFKSNVTA